MTQALHPGSRARVRLPMGVRDFLPDAAARRRDIAERLLSLFEQWGFERIMTPMFECADVLERGLGKDARAAALRFVEPTSGEVVAMRPDITPQVARIAATRLGDVGGPLRLCYEGAVMRLEEGPRGQREILQAGAELVGAPPPAGDVEAIALAAAALASTRIGELRLDLGHMALVRHALAGLEDGEMLGALETALVKKDRAGIARASAGLPPEKRELLDLLPGLYGPPADVLARARAIPLPEEVSASIDGLSSVIDQLRDLVDEELYAGITVDLGEVRGFDYYTGIRFSGYAAGAGEAVLQGGRYDQLLSRYGQGARATGFAVDIEAVARAQRACDTSRPARRDRVLVAPSEDRTAEAARMASLLRGESIPSAVHLGDQDDDAALLRYARQVGFSRVLMLDAGGGARAYCVDKDAGQQARPVKAETLAAATAGAAAGLSGLFSALALEARGR